MGKIFVHEGDLPDDFDAGNAVAIDSETMGLMPGRDRLCVVQISTGDGNAHLVKFANGPRQSAFNAPNLNKILTDTRIVKIFHYARFDIAVMDHYLGVMAAPVYCTKIASKLVRTYTDRHGLKDLSRELLGVEMDKQQQSSDWGADTLSEAQQKYAASEVLHVHKLRKKLDIMLEREGRTQLAHAAFAFLPIRAKMDLHGFQDVDIFSH